MSWVNFDAANIGNTDFDNGIEALTENLRYANFPLINCKYDFKNRPQAHKFPPKKIILKSGIKIGVLGVCIEPTGLVLPMLFGNTFYQDPIVHAPRIANYLLAIKQVIILSAFRTSATATTVIR